MRLMNETELSELSLELNDIKLTIRKGVPGAAVVTTPFRATEQAPAAAPNVAAEPAAVAVNEQEILITAPMVGTFYRAPAPDAPPYVEVGDRVEIGQTLCIIEAMKLMNEIESEATGRLVRVLVENGQPVQYGDPLFVLVKE